MGSFQYGDQVQGYALSAILKIRQIGKSKWQPFSPSIYVFPQKISLKKKYREIGLFYAE